MALSADSLPDHRPPRLRLSSLDLEWWRLDERPPTRWSWTGYPEPRNRFDAPGRRVRYAARTERGAFREHFADRHRLIAAEHAADRVVLLRGRLRVLDLRSELVLDQLGVDAEISTGRDPRVLRACWQLSELLQVWYGERLQGILYTSRTTPQTSANLAFFRHSPLRAREVGRIADRTSQLAQLIADDAFRVELPGW